MSTDSGGYKTQYLSWDGSRPPTSHGHQTMEIDDFNSLQVGQNMRYPSVVNERSVNSHTTEHNISDLRLEVANLRHQKQELEKQNFICDVQLSTLQ